MSGPYTNSTIYLPSQSNFDYLEFYISEDTTGAGRLAKEVWYQIEESILTIKGAFPAVRDFYSGSFFHAPARWSPITDLYLTYLDDQKAKFLGAAAAQAGTKLYYIVVPIERAEFDAVRTIDPKHIRYLVRIHFQPYQRPNFKFSTISIHQFAKKSPQSITFL